MAYHPHFRLTWSGTLPNGEIWSNSLALVKDAAPFETAAEFFNSPGGPMNLTESWDDIVADVSDFHSRGATRIVMDCVLKRVVLAVIDENGHYAGNPREAAVNVPGGAANGWMPHQIARKVTLETDGDLGRIKGGWFIPRPSNWQFDYATNLWSAENTTEVRDSVKEFLDDLENASGLDTYGLQVVIASQGRHNKNGSVRVAEGNHRVKRVNVGRRADVQRRRANKITEARIADVTLADNG